MYRDVVKIAKSHYRMAQIHPSLRLVYILGSFSGYMTKLIAEANGFAGKDYHVRLDSDLTAGVALYAIITARYLDLRQRGFEIKALRYEDFVARPLDMCRVILEYCRLPVSLAELGIKAFEVDSQRNSRISKSVMASLKEPELTPELKARLNELLKKYKMPLIGEPGILEGSLSCK